MNAERTIIVPASLAPLARTLAACVAPGGVGMFTTALASISAPTQVTHYISSGWIDASFTAMLSDAALLHTACTAAGATVTLTQCQELVTPSVVSDGTTTVLIDGVSTVVLEGPHVLIARLGLCLAKG